MSNGIGDITKLAKYGWPGVVISLVIALIIVIVLFLNFLGTHTDKTTTAVQDLKTVVERLNYNLERRDLNMLLDFPIASVPLK